MVIAIFGESCTGKSTLAEGLKDALQAEVYTGKDYIRLHKNEKMAEVLFKKQLGEAVNGNNIIYVIAEKEHMVLIPESAVRILVTEELDVIKKRFAKRMHGNLPAPVAAMLERKHGLFDTEPCDIHVHAGSPTAEQIIEQLHLKG